MKYGFFVELLSASAFKKWDFPSCCGIVGMGGPFPMPDLDNLMFELPACDDWDPLNSKQKDSKMRNHILFLSFNVVFV